jgi:hypothetical protein
MIGAPRRSDPGRRAAGRRGAALASFAPLAKTGEAARSDAPGDVLSGDPRLDGLMAEIELRAAVELAKLDVARGV